MEDTTSPGSAGRRRSSRRRASALSWNAARSLGRTVAATLVALTLVACDVGPAPRPSGPRPAPAAPSAPAVPAPPPAVAAPEPEPDIDGTGVAILVDLSGSMAEKVKNRAGRPEPKHAIATRALGDILTRLETAAAPGADGRRLRLDVGLYTFNGNDVRALRPIRPFDAADLRKAVTRLGSPDSHTPLGNALKRAMEDLLAGNLRRRHVLVITDGENTAGPDPAAVMPGVLHAAEARGVLPLGVHFVAFDVDAAVFSGVKALGATIVSASDESQLGERLGWILDTKILLEDEEPATKPPADK